MEDDCNVVWLKKTVLYPVMESLDTPMHNPDYAEISVNHKTETVPEGKIS